MRVSLFVTCLVDQFHPEVGTNMVAVLERLGIEHDFPEAQTCCGQPALNSGFPDEARTVGRHALRVFHDAELVVTPSGSCASMLTRHLPALFAPGSTERKDADTLAARVREFSDFLVNVAGVTDVGAAFPHRVAYHDACHLLRDLGIRDEPRRLLRDVRGLDLVELPAADECCGFGGLFAVRHPHISLAMGDEKLTQLHRSGAEVLVASDTGCLMHLRGMLARRGSAVRALHLADVLGRPGLP